MEKIHQIRRKYKEKAIFSSKILKISRYYFQFYISNLTFSLHPAYQILGRTQVIIIILSVFILFYTEYKKSSKISTHILFSTTTGLLAGFTTMIGNLAGPISNIYFLAIRLPKNEFIGTSAWLFFIINIFKLPFHFFVWKTVTKETLLLNSVLIPAAVLGFFIGVVLVKRISNLNYRRFILFVTTIGALVLLFK